MLDTDALTEIQNGLIEDATFSSALWMTAEVLGYFNLRQYAFLKRTRITASWTMVPWVPAQPEHDLPADWIDTIAARWHSFADETWTPVPRSDSFELDHASQDTALTTLPPQGFRDSDLATLRIVLGPPPIAPGELEIIYVSLSAVLDGTGIGFEIPDVLGPYLKYGVLADMLSKEGRGQDLLRARYCEQRFEEGVALAQALLSGWA